MSETDPEIKPVGGASLDPMTAAEEKAIWEGAIHALMLSPSELGVDQMRTPSATATGERKPLSFNCPQCGKPVAEQGRQVVAYDRNDRPRYWHPNCWYHGDPEKRVEKG